MPSHWLVCAFFAICIHTEISAISSSKALTLASHAKQILTKNNSESRLQAIQIFEDVLQDSSFRRLDLSTKVEIIKILADLYHKEGLYKTEQTLISKLLSEPSYSPHWTELKLHLANSLHDQNKIDEADFLLSQLLREPKRRLSHIESQEIASLLRKIENSYQELLAQSCRLYHSKQYTDAKNLLQSLVTCSERRRFPYTRSSQNRQEIQAQIQLYLASCHYQLQEFEQAVLLSARQDLPYLEKMESTRSIYWQNKYLYALSCNQTEQFEKAHAAFARYLSEFPEHNSARIEALFSAIKAHHFSQAALHEKLLEANELEPKLQKKLYALKILGAIEAHNQHLAEKLLQADAAAILTNDELNFLHGLYCYKIKDYEQAVQFFEKTAPKYSLDTLYLLGISYLELGKKDANAPYLERALSCFEELSNKKHPSWQKKANLGKSLCNESNPTDTSTKNFVNAFHQELKKDTFVKSHPFFIEIISSLKDTEKETALSLLNTYQKALLSYSQNDTQNELEECAYYASLLDEKASDLFFERFPKSIYRNDLLFYLGLKKIAQNEHELACEYLLRLLDSSPRYTKLDKVLYFLAHASQNPKQYYTALYTTYPDSPLASESYFRLFAESEYNQGNAVALLHLRKMPPALQKGPFGLLASFYIAQNIRQECPETDASEAQCALLQEAIARYDRVTEKSKSILDQVPLFMKEPLEKIGLQSRSECAKARLMHASNSSQSTESFDECKRHLEQTKKLLEEKINTSKDLVYYSLWQECARTLTRVFLLKGDEGKAREELEHLIDYSEKLHFSDTDAVLLSMCELASFHIRAKQFTDAKLLLEKAEKQHKNNLAREPLLLIWLTKSDLSRKTGHLDEAMMLLSRVINDDSASSLRVQAMYLRSELYELKGRRDLSLKQLEACAKKGGPWAEQARRKLEVQYGYG